MVLWIANFEAMTKMKTIIPSESFLVMAWHRTSEMPLTEFMKNYPITQFGEAYMRSVVPEAGIKGRDK